MFFGLRCAFKSQDEHLRYQSWESTTIDSQLESDNFQLMVINDSHFKNNNCSINDY